MVQTLFRVVKRVFLIVGMVLWTAFLGAATWLMAQLYLAERHYSQFLEEGQPVTVHIASTNRDARQIWDSFGRVAYAKFNYQQRPYEVRWVDDTTWLSEGDRVLLLYHPGMDAFEQPRREVANQQKYVVSRLVNWSVLSLVDRKYQVLAGLLVVGCFLFFSVGGLLTELTGSTLLQPIARLVLVVVLLGCAVFFSYDALQKYRYVQTLKSEGQRMSVQVTHTDRVRQGRKQKYWRTHTYKATFQFRGRQRVIAIEESEYHQLAGGTGPLVVQYALNQDDFVSGRYSLGFSLVLVPLFFWLILGVFTWNLLVKRTATRPVVG